MVDRNHHQRVRRNFHFLSSFGKLNKKQQQALMEHLDNDQVKFLCEVAWHVLHNRVKLSESQLNALRPFRSKMRHLDGKCALREKKEVLMTGRFLPSLLAAVASSILPMIVDKLFSNAKG